MSARRVGCNLLWLVPGVVGGTETYAVALLRALASLGPDDLDVTLFVNRRTAARHPDLLERYDHVVAPFDGPRPVRVAMEVSWLGAAARRRDVELLHHLGGTMPLVDLGGLPGRGGVPGLVSIHDLQPWAMPENFSRLKRVYLHGVVPPSARRARGVIALSAWAASDITARLGVPAQRIRVIAPVVAPPPALDPIELMRRLQSMDLARRPFLVYPAITYPHKNHVTLLRAFRRILDRHPEAVLVLTGSAGPHEAQVAQVATELGLGGSLRRLGRVSDDQLDALYRGACALTFPSAYEGFGIPVVEAMARGCPVIASRATALPEAVGGAGVLVDPFDVEGWATAMDGMLSDGAARESWVELGRRRARERRPEVAGEQLAAAYRWALDEGTARGQEGPANS